MKNQRQVILLVILGGIILTLALLWNSLTVTLRSGEAGVLYERFGKGTVTDFYYTEGFHFKAPWNDVFVYEVRTNEQKETMEVLSQNGLNIKLDLSLRYAPDVNNLGFLHKTYGAGYMVKVVIPEVRSAAREVIGKYTPEELYSSKKDQIQTEIYELSRTAINERFINLEAVLLRGITLPPSIQQAIERKLQQEQESQEYAFRIEKEKKEAERKRIEAQGIKDFQDIVSEGISDRLLRWKGIEATLKLAESENSKVVIVGQGDDGLPLILGGN